MDILHKKIRSLTLKQIAYAVATADAGNVSLAARRLNVSQPAISTAIQALESLFGHKIFARNPGQGVTPTSFGQTVLGEARALLAQVESFSSLGDPAEMPRGQVVLGCSSLLAPQVLPSLLRHLEETLPSIDIKFVVSDADDTPTLLRQDNADMAIAFDMDFGDGMDTHILFAAPARVLCAADHPFASRDGVDIDDLRDETLILLDQAPSPNQLLGLLKDHGIEPTIAARVSEYELQRALIANGFGVGVSHAGSSIGPSRDGKPLTAVPFGNPPMTQRVLLARCVQPRYHPAVAAVHDAILDRFRATKMGSAAPGS